MAQLNPGQPPQQAGNPLPVVGFNKYSLFYADAQNDPFHGDYNNIMSTFAVPVNNAAVPAPAALAATLTQSINAGIPNAFLALTGDPNDEDDLGTVCLFHRVTGFAARIGMPVTAWDDTLFAFKGDVHHGQIAVVSWGAELFNQSGGLVRVPSLAQAAQELAAAPNLEFFGPYGNNDAGTEVVRTRRSMFVPPKYVNLFLNEDMGPTRAFERLYAATTADGTVVTMTPLLTWLLVAGTRPAEDQHSALVHAQPTVPLADPTLQAFIWRNLTRDLTGLDPGAANNQGLQVVATEIGTLVAEARLTRQDAISARAQASAPKGPGDYYGARLQILLRLCQVQTKAQLPLVYHALANTKKRQSDAIMTQYLDAAAQDLQIENGIQLTPALARRLATAEWNVISTDNLELGIHHFHVTFRLPDDRELYRQLIESHSLVTQEGASASLEDVHALMAASKISLPWTWVQVRHTMANMWLLCHTFLGEHHPMTRELEKVFRDYTKYDSQLEFLKSQHDTPSQYLPACFVRWMQVRFSVWARRQMDYPAAAPVPALSELYEKILIGEDWIPQFPSGVLQTNAPPAAIIPTATLPAAPVYPAPAPAPALPAAAGQPARSNRQVNNTAWKTSFQVYRDMPIRARDLRIRLQSQNVAIPKTAGGRERCLAWHVKGLCNEACRNVADHVPGAAADDQALLEWCQTNWHG